MNDFSKKTITELANRGIEIVGIAGIPARSGCGFVERVYQLLVQKDDMLIVRRHEEVIALSKS